MESVRQSYKELYGLDGHHEKNGFDYKMDVGVFLTDELTKAEQFAEILTRVTSPPDEVFKPFSNI